jgi:hypothetical protein
MSCVTTSTSASSPSFRRGSGVRMTVRDGWRSAMPASVRSATASHSFGAHTRCVITLVRSTFAGRASLRARSTAAIDVSVSAVATSGRPAA